MAKRKGRSGTVRVHKVVDARGRDFKVRLEDDGNLHLVTDDPVCDFCCLGAPAWTYPAARMEIVGHPVMTASRDDWACCEQCHAFIEAHDLDGLFEYIKKMFRRSLYEQRLAGKEMYEPGEVWENARQNVLRFFDARLGPPFRETKAQYHDRTGK
jgi:hypothetical protein